MIESVQIVLVALLALFLGVVTPVLLSLRSTAKRAEKLMDHLDERVFQVLDQTSAVLGHADRIGLEVSHGSQAVGKITHALDGFADSMLQIQKSLRVAVAVGSALAPALVAAVQSLRRPPDGEAAEAEHATQAQAEGEMPMPPGMVGYGEAAYGAEEASPELR